MATQSVENVLKLTPTDELRFKGSCNDVITEEVLISNLSAKRMSFKVKTTAPRCYCVRPNSGVIESNSSVTVSFMLQPLEKDGMSKLPHKFMVQAIFVPTTSDDFSNMWSAAKPTDIMTAKLTSVVELSSRQHRPKLLIDYSLCYCLIEECTESKYSGGLEAKWMLYARELYSIDC